MLLRSFILMYCVLLQSFAVLRVFMLLRSFAVLSIFTVLRGVPGLSILLLRGALSFALIPAGVSAPRILFYGSLCRLFSCSALSCLCGLLFSVCRMHFSLCRLFFSD
jgi:hypothetical protein